MSSDMASTAQNWESEAESMLAYQKRNTCHKRKGLILTAEKDMLYVHSYVKSYNSSVTLGNATTKFIDDGIALVCVITITNQN